MDSGKSLSGIKKGKKKQQVKDELDRIKQAEKKKRRLEKALATSAAIISELEKKKQKKKEEQQRLDEEGAAIAEAVALQVLIGEKKKRRLEKALATSAAIISELEKKKQKKKEEQQRLDEEGAAIAEAVALQVLIGEEDSDDTSTRGSRQGFYGNRNEGFGWILNAHGGSRCEWNGYGYGYGCGDDVSSAVGLMAAQAVSSLNIGDDEDMNGFVFNRMVRG